MGLTAFFFAAKASLDDTEVALRKTWHDELSALKREERASLPWDDVPGSLSNVEGTLLVLWRDGGFTCWAETELGLTDDSRLAALSERLGTVLVAAIADHGGSYAFGVYRDGQRRRWLQENPRRAEGPPLPEETGLALAPFGEEAVELLWSRFGLQSYLSGAPPFRVLHR